MAVKEKVTLVLPSEIMATVRTMVTVRGQSQFVAEAIEYYVAEQQRKSLRERLIAGYQANTDADVAISTEWESLENEIWTQ